ncbi:MAG TPA: hypothetical protein VGS02_03250 [Acidobacteriaceae bacterium]|nr:hypothetical protein [Acidobacteriaceae bacterium]
METELTACEDRRCIELTLSGHHCRGTPVAERDRCYIHGLFRALNDGRSTIDIPLLEDPQAILYVYSQVARALAQGAMPAANASGIIRCCKGAERLLEQQLKRERFEERKKKTGVRTQESESAQPAASPLAKDQQAQTHATVPQNFDNCEEPGCPMSPVDGDMGGAECSIACPERESNGSPAVEDAAGCPMSPAVEDMGSDPPQPWNVERPLPVVPPPQFADAPEKFQRTIERVSDQRLEANLRRDRAIRARGGRATDFYRNGEGVRCDIRDTWSPHTDPTATDSTPRPASEPLSS